MNSIDLYPNLRLLIKLKNINHFLDFFFFFFLATLIKGLFIIAIPVIPRKPFYAPNYFL